MSIGTLHTCIEGPKYGSVYKAQVLIYSTLGLKIAICIIAICIIGKHETFKRRLGFIKWAKLATVLGLSSTKNIQKYYKNDKSSNYHIKI